MNFLFTTCTIRSVWSGRLSRTDNHTDEAEYKVFVTLLHPARGRPPEMQVNIMQFKYSMIY